ncbi:MAG TPA: FkbM family methyltransferase, partial [Rhizorhapis sp.]|nr:FkbM family methyltransferase [Rhizorhapis sp.]
YPQTQTVGKLGVPVRPLRTMLPQIQAPALLKIDVQGAELEVLKGCGDMLAAFDHIYVELSFRELYLGQPLASEVICWLAERGFTACGVYNVSTIAGGASVQADFLFQRQP